ncbi:MAG: 50S ribosomal protein L32 [Patescibacteria group bacterium UBA2163]
MRATRSHTKNRRSHHALKGERLSVEKNSGSVHPRHRALLDGTTYRGRSVMDKNTKGKTQVTDAPVAEAEAEEKTAPKNTKKVAPKKKTKKEEK